MATQKDCTLSGTWWEGCIREGQCPLCFGRDLWPEAGQCTSFQTYEIEEGRVQGVDMKGIRVIHVFFGIGPKMTDMLNGIEEAAVYVSDNATDEQRKLLEPIVAKGGVLSKLVNVHIWKKLLGVKYVNINVSKKNGTYHITMPFGEFQTSLTVGWDRKTPITITNGPPFLSDYKICNVDFWKFYDYGKNMELHNTSGGIADFCYS